MSNAAEGLPQSQNDVDAAVQAAEPSPAPADARLAPDGEAVSAAPSADANVEAEGRPSHGAAAGVRTLNLPDLLDEGSAAPESGNIDLLRDVDLHVKIELGRSRMFVEDVLRLGPGSVVELDKLAGDPVDVLVNERLVARGEVLVLNDNFCVRINEILSGVEDVT
jgi:flagellar motor switch protein FliN